MFHSVLSGLARNIVLSLATFPPGGAEPDVLGEMVGARGAEAVNYKRALKALEGTWIRISDAPDRPGHIHYADPSCRDFILALLDSEPSLADSLIESSRSLRQVSRILSYASARVRNDLKYPALAAHVSRDPALVLGRVQSLLDVQSLTNEEWEAFPETAFNTEVMVPLSEIAEASRTLSRDIWRATVGAIIEFIDRYSTVSYFSPDALMTTAMSLLASADITEMQKPYVETILSAWSDEVLTGDDLGNLAEFLGGHSGLLEDLGVPTDSLFDAFVKGVRDELKDIISNSDDPDGAYAWLAELEDAATRIGIRSELAAAFESTNQSIAEWDDEYREGERPHRPSRPEVGPASVRLFPTARERAYIDSLFTHLE